MKAIGIPHQYACFECRKSYKRAQFSASNDSFMTSEQGNAQQAEAEALNNRECKCPDCGGATHFMGTDFKAPKKTDKGAWLKVQKFIGSGKVYYRGSQDAK
jgi:hypothetical protein